MANREEENLSGFVGEMKTIEDRLPYYNQKPKPWTLRERIRLWFKPVHEFHGIKVKVMDGVFWIVGEPVDGKKPRG